MSGTSQSINNVRIRLTQERWEHIVDSHPGLSSYRELVLDAIEKPDYILRGKRGTFAAVVLLRRKALLHVFYIERSRDDGFILTARIAEQLDKARIIWRRDDHEL